MALHELPDLAQGSDDWHDQRRGMVTASVVGQLITASTLKPARNDTSRGLTATLIAERITGHTEPAWMNDDMLRGVLSEPIARDLYAKWYAAEEGLEVTETGFLIRDDWGWSLGYSPDGKVGDHGLIEVKAPRAKGHIRTILADEVPAYNMAQLQAGLLVSGREWIDFISYSGGLPLWVKRVHPDPRWAEAIVDVVSAFEQVAAEQVERFDELTRDLIPTERTDHAPTDLGLVF